MKKSYKLKDYILKYPVLFWVVALTYIVSVIILTVCKRDVEALYFIVSYAIIGIVFTIYYLFFASKEQKDFTKNWFEIVFIPTKKISSPKTLHRILTLSGWGAIFCILASLSYLFKLPGFSSLVFFILQILVTIPILIIYIGKERINSFIDKIKFGTFLGVILSFTYLVIDFISKTLGRSFVTNTISVLPEQVPTITQGLQWFCFILIASTALLFIVIFLVDLAKNKKLLNKISFITYFLVCISAVLPCHLIIFNAIVIIDVVISKTYDADTVLYFKCDNKIIKNVPNDTARYLKVDEQEFRAFYFEKDKSNIQMTTYFCDGSDYSEIDIHK